MMMQVDDEEAYFFARSINFSTYLASKAIFAAFSCVIGHAH